MFSQHKLFPLFIGFILIAVAAWLQVTSHTTAQRWLRAFNNLAYDVQLRATHNKANIDPNSPIIIVAVDDKSLAEQGRWPWPRNKLATLVKNLHEAGVAVIAMDMTFPEPEQNIAQEILTRHPHLKDAFKTIVPEFNYDQLFANSLRQSETILGVTLQSDFKGYTGNIPLLQAAAKGAGFVNVIPDEDGIMRRALLVTQGYSSLALEAIRRYTFTDKIELVTALQGKTITLQGIRLGNQTILTDSEGRVLIPFRGTAYSFPYFSATDILAHRIAPSALKDKLVFVGATAFGLGDNHATSVQNIYPGVEVHATVASGILSNYFPTRPAWAPGAEWVMLVLAGTLAAFIFPFLGPAFLTLITGLFAIGLFFLNSWLWQTKGIVLSLFLPISLVLLLAVFNMAYGYLFENRRREQLKSMFGQYVPSDHVDAMLADPSQYGFQGQSKEMTVLFADIRNFTALSEKLSASELKDMLNQYLTPMTEIIFKHHGTIDKYVGDMIMAFWNAPLSDVHHARQAIRAALEMQAATTLPIGIGINTGTMNVGDMGSTFRRAYTVLGDAVNLASRLEGQTKYYGVKIIVGEETYQQTKSEFLFRKLDKIRVKGKEQGVTIYQPLCLLSNATEDLKQQVEAHHQALTAYFAQQWDLAEQGLTDTLYVARMAGFRKTPPPKEWDGVYESHDK
ncbi:MAG: CHASE2 domain-containing protein [Gammaproteobacteria bacterium]